MPVTLTDTARKGTAPASSKQPRTSTRVGTKKRKTLFTKSKKPVRKNSIDFTSNSIYDGNGKIRGTKENLCDCFDVNCAGCHFECEMCRSQKCGNVCRRFRKYAFEVIEYDGKDKVDRNKNVQPEVSKESLIQKKTC